MKAVNLFHNTEIEIDVIETYQTETGQVAVVAGEDLDRAAKRLCGCDCTCHKVAYIEDEQGERFTVMVK